jgi:hypothetical protein
MEPLGRIGLGKLVISRENASLRLALKDFLYSFSCRVILTQHVATMHDETTSRAQASDRLGLRIKPCAK